MTLTTEQVITAFDMLDDSAPSVLMLRQKLVSDGADIDIALNAIQAAVNEGHLIQEGPHLRKAVKDCAMFESSIKPDLRFYASMANLITRQEANDPKLRELKQVLRDATARQKNAREEDQTAALQAENEAVAALVEYAQLKMNGFGE